MGVNGSARCVMVLGTSSGAGKSWLVTALCRHYARQGLKVAPFKAQNMSNNARVVAGTRSDPQGFGEIGSAQYFQALAARCVPDVRMNPVLLKPEADTRSQVVLLGEVHEALSRTPWRERSASLWPHIAGALDALRAESDLVVIEGAGSPAEINLSDSDVVNLRVARHAQARCLLVTDIDRGGAFAHLYGTWALLEAEDRARIRGFVLNKFRGDASLLAPAPELLERMTGIPTMATLPMWWDHGLPEEDGLHPASPSASAWAGNAPVRCTIAVIAYPRISNLDEFQALRNLPGVRLVWARQPADCAAADWLILPGSKHTSADLAWLRERGLDAVVTSHAASGKPVLGICGGFQMLGDALLDTEGVDGNAPGLGLLPLVTQFARRKTVRPAQLEFAAGLAARAGPWRSLAGVGVRGYEIHHGVTRAHEGLMPTRQGREAMPVLPDGRGWCDARGNVMGVYLHGLFEDARVLQCLFGARDGAPPRTLDAVFDGLADFAAAHFEPAALDSLMRT